jgi:hypothetical protein
MSLFWKPSTRRIVFAAILLVLAYIAHALPVVWMCGLLAYVAAARRLAPIPRAGLTAAFLAAMVGCHFLIGRFVVTRWSLSQIALTTGVDQMWIFDGKYYLVLAGLLLVWALLFLGLIRHSGARQVVASIPFHLCVIGAATVVILPGAVLLPGIAHVLGFIAERMSLGVAVCVCALLATVQPRVIERYALLVVAIVFFGFVYRDERALNAFEDRMQDVVSALPPGERVVNAIGDPWLRANPLAHMIDRVCVGRCYSYANYEPSTRQFRVRAARKNGVVAAAYKDSWHLQCGDYVVREDDVPLYAVDIGSDGRMKLKALKPGVPNGKTDWSVL